MKVISVVQPWWHVPSVHSQIDQCVRLCRRVLLCVNVTHLQTVTALGVGVYNSAPWVWTFLCIVVGISTHVGRHPQNSSAPKVEYCEQDAKFCMFFMSLSLPDVFSVIFLSGSDRPLPGLTAEVQTKGNICWRCFRQIWVSKNRRVASFYSFWLCCWNMSCLWQKSIYHQKCSTLQTRTKVPVVPAVET